MLWKMFVSQLIILDNQCLGMMMLKISPIKKETERERKKKRVANSFIGR